MSGGFFADADPLGFVLFRRNCRDPDQLRALVAEMRDAVGRADAPVLIDQEGGRVARLQPPHWRAYPAAAQLGALPDPLAEEAARLGRAADRRRSCRARHRRSIALPVLDLPAPRRRSGDRRPRLWQRAGAGRAARPRRMRGAVGRRRVAGHQAHPRARPRRGSTAIATCRGSMPAATSCRQNRFRAVPRAVGDAVGDDRAYRLHRDRRRRAGDLFAPGHRHRYPRRYRASTACLISDDISMGALEGSLAERTRRALAAGCDLALHCNGVLAEMEEVADAAPPLTRRRRRRGSPAARRCAGSWRRIRPRAPPKRVSRNCWTRPAPPEAGHPHRA